MKLEELSISVIEDFKDSLVWLLMLDDLNEMREGILSDLEDAPVDDVRVKNEDGSISIVKGVKKLQGAISILKHILKLPDMMIAELKSMEDIKDERSNGETDSGD